MKNVYKFYVKKEDGRIYESAGKFASRESAKKKINGYYKLLTDGEKILAWKIVNALTGETIEQSGIM